MLISVIVPVYNVEKYLKKCVTSIIENSFKNLEIILIDDVSTDTSGKICDELADMDTRIKVIHKNNGGLSSARNAGLNIATGDYISFIDSDDYIDKNMLKKMLDKALEHGADIVQCGVFRINEKGEKKTTFQTEDGIYYGKKILDNFFIKQNIPVMVCNKLFSRSLIGKCRMMDGHNNEDNIFMIDILPKAKCVVSLHAQLYYYLIRSDSIMKKTFTEKRFDSIYAYKYTLKKTKIIGSEYIPYVQYWRCMNSFYLWYDIKRANLPKESRDKYYKIVEKEFESTYPYVIKLGQDICQKDRIRLALFKMNKNLAVNLYHRYMRG